MDKNIILAGVGGQGILSIAFCICNAALKKGMNVKQAEVHGMAQRGGAVESHVRISSKPIHSDMVPMGRADLVLSVEPLEALRYVQFLSGTGVLMSSAAPFVNIPDYPEMASVFDRFAEFKHHILVDSKRLASLAGSGRADNMVMLGAATDVVGFEPAEMDEFIHQLFGKKSERVVEVNCRALRIGRLAAEQYRKFAGQGLSPEEALKAVEETDLASSLEDAYKLPV